MISTHYVITIKYCNWAKNKLQQLTIKIIYQHYFLYGGKITMYISYSVTHNVHEQMQ